MRKNRLLMVTILFVSAGFYISCQKDVGMNQKQEEEIAPSLVNENAETPPFNLEVILRGEDNKFGHIKYRQDIEDAKIISLETWVRGLEPNHSYLLQRAVDAINVVDGNCTSTSWLTLGKGLTPQSILTNENGTGGEELWRDISMIPSGSAFDIHFRVVDAISMNVVLASDCYKYVVR